MNNSTGGATYSKRPLVVTNVEALVLRSPNDPHSPDHYVQMPPLGQ
jgi:hypothetical protein